MSQKTKPRRRSAFRLPRTAFAGYSIAVANRQRRWAVDKIALKSAAACVLRGEGIAKADVSIAVVDDTTIHEINRQYLKHDEPTDVISFMLDDADGCLDGEVVISADTAAAASKRFGWSAESELLLYVIHGLLHLTGYDDLAPSAKRRMRSRERRYLREMGIEQ